MKKETFINGNKTILDTNRYLELLSCESREVILIKYLESLLTGKDIVDKFIVTGVLDLLKMIKGDRHE